MNALLLDTNALLWYLLQPARLTEPAQRAIRTAASLAISAATVWEVLTKHRIGKLPEADLLVRYGLLTALDSQRIAVLPISGADAERAGTHPALHRDPFDRMIAAQAVIHALSVVSSDPQLDAFGVARVW